MKITNQFFLYTAVAILMASCSATNQLTLSTVEPAPVNISNDVRSIGIINRSQPNEANSPLDDIDKVLSAEGRHLDKHGAEAAIRSLKDELERSQRFDKIVILDSIPQVRKGLGVLPASLSWKLVEDICRKYEVDVLFSLGFYDTDTKATYKATFMELPNNLGIKAKVPAHEVTLQTQIQNGWRVYDPATKEVLDEYAFNNTVVSRGSGVNPIKAVKAVINRKEAVVETSSNIGQRYGMRITPYKRRVTRTYFVRGNTNFEVAKRRAQSGKWNSAAELWEQEVSNPNAKIAGRACYNMAIISEINGDLNEAMDWAAKSYSDYNVRDALRYMDILRYRMAQKQELNRQLSR